MSILLRIEVHSQWRVDCGGRYRNSSISISILTVIFSERQPSLFRKYLNALVLVYIQTHRAFRC